jgi:hypothetical protein
VTTSTPRLQLWKEEAAIISALISAVPDGGTIVEIGTAEGGTALLAHEACAGRTVEIYTVDIDPSRIATETLFGTGVHVITQASEVFAQEWPARVGRKIDYLFIDGNHDLEHVAGDWNAWLPHLAPDGRVAFHDFDPPYRGGMAHFAVRVCGDTILRRGLLSDAKHEFKLLYGRVDNPARSAISAADCRETLAMIGRRITSLLATSSDDVSFAVDTRLEALLRLALGGNVSTAGPAALSGPRTVWWSRHSAVTRPDAVVVETLDSAAICYLAEQALCRNYASLAEIVSAHSEFLAWGEALQMLNHGCPGQRLPADVPAAGASLSELSSFVAREQVRLILLARLLSLCVGWTP